MVLKSQLHIMRNLSFTAISLLVTLYVQGQNPNQQIEGIWWNEEKSSRVEVFEENGKIYGALVYLKDNKNPDGTTPKLDNNNPEEDFQSRKLVGLRILTDLEWDEDDNEWDDGEIYDPKSGNTYSCYAHLQKDGKLYLKGYVLGMPFLGRSTLWTKYQ